MTQFTMRLQTKFFAIPCYTYIQFTEKYSYLNDDNKIVRMMKQVDLNYTEAVEFCHEWIKENPKEIHKLKFGAAIQIIEETGSSIKQIVYQITVEKAKRLIL